MKSVKIVWAVLAAAAGLWLATTQADAQATPQAGVSQELRKAADAGDGNAMYNIGFL